MNNRGLFAAGAVFFLAGLVGLFLLENKGLAISFLSMGFVFLVVGGSSPAQEDDDPSDSTPPAE